MISNLIYLTSVCINLIIKSNIINIGWLEITKFNNFFSKFPNSMEIWIQQILYFFNDSPNWKWFLSTLFQTSDFLETHFKSEYGKPFHNCSFRTLLLMLYEHLLWRHKSTKLRRNELVKWLVINKIIFMTNEKLKIFLC